MVVSRKRILEILEQAQEGDRTSLFVDRFLSFLIITNILAVSLESVESIGIAYRQAFLIFEYFSVVIFGFEYLLRIWSSAERTSGAAQTATGRRLAYIFSFNGLVDLNSSKPFGSGSRQCRPALGACGAAIAYFENLELFFCPRRPSISNLRGTTIFSRGFISFLHRAFYRERSHVRR